jgi:hypothetical protein
LSRVAARLEFDWQKRRATLSQGAWSMPHTREEVRAALDANLAWLQRLPGVTAVSMSASETPKIRIYHSALAAETWNQITERLGDMVERGPAMDQQQSQ